MTVRVALLACASLFVAGAAFADPPIGSRVGQRLDKEVNQSNNERDAAQVAHEFAGCVLAKKGSTGRDLLNARSDDEVKRLEANMNGEIECLANLPGNDFVEEVGVTYPPDIMRGDLAEELLKKDRRGFETLPPLPLQKIYSRSWFAFTGRDVSVDEMAACVADTDPAGIGALIDSHPFSDSEAAAFAALVPYMGPCLRAGTKLEGKRDPLRAALAEALYQRVMHPAESTVTPPQSSQATAK